MKDSMRARLEQYELRPAAIDVPSDGPATARCHDDLGLVLVELGLGDPHGFFKVFVRELRIDDRVSILNQFHREQMFVFDSSLFRVDGRADTKLDIGVCQTRVPTRRHETFPVGRECGRNVTVLFVFGEERSFHQRRIANRFTCDALEQRLRRHQGPAFLQ